MGKATEKPVIVGDALELGDYFKDRSYQSLWSSPEKYIRHIETLKEKDAWSDSGWSKGDDSFYGTKSMEEALTLAKDGWKEGVDQIERVRGKILTLHPLQKRPAKWDIVGSVPSVPRAVAGDIRNMKAPESASARKRPVITLVSNMAALCYIDNHSLSNRAAVLAALIDQIEARGFACEVLSVACSASGAFRCNTAIMVKESHQPVDVKKLAFAMGHASMFRRLVFADKGSEPSCKNGLGYGLGSTERDFSKDRAHFKEKGVYSIDSIMASGEDIFKTEDKASTEGLTWIIDHLRDQGCPAFPKFSEAELRAKELKTDDDDGPKLKFPPLFR